MIYRLLILLISIFYASLMYGQELQIYRLTSFYEAQKNTAFCSFSDKHLMSEHPDSSSVPDLKSMNEEKIEYFHLNGIYRQRFLDDMNFRESDSVFIYDYRTDVLISTEIKEVQIAAMLSPYETADANDLSQYEYMIGFEFTGPKLKELSLYYEQSLVYVGKQNPFVQGKMKTITWTKIDSSSVLPKIENSKLSLYLRSRNHVTYKRGNIYSYQNEKHTYFIEDIITTGYIDARRLVIMKNETQEVVCEEIYTDSEGTSLVEINMKPYKTDVLYYQWTGLLFKNKAPVVFGFEHISFGCPKIDFLDGDEESIWINCDNRH